MPNKTISQLLIELNEEVMFDMNDKTYYFALKEISKNDLFDGLLGYGLFSEKIPSFLTSVNFLEFCKTKSNLLNSNSKGDKGNNYIQYKHMRNINIPRIFSIPEPFAYYKLCKILRDNWENELLPYFKNKTKNQNHKISRVHIRKMVDAFSIFSDSYEEDLDDINLDDYPDDAPKHLFDTSFSNPLRDDTPEIDLLIGSRYKVKVDISNFFGSIYTHSIPWALVGRDISKDSKKDFSSWYNTIDIYTRYLKNNETHGILIGNHASHIISEIILVAIDFEMQEKESKYKYIRRIDDYTCYTESLIEAERFILDLEQELNKFGLYLNNFKTIVEELPVTSDGDWVSKINLYFYSLSRENKKINLSQIKNLLDYTLILMKQNMDNAAIINYALKLILKFDFNDNAKKYFLKTICHLSLLYPYLIPLLEPKVIEMFKDDQKIYFIKNILDIGTKQKLNEAVAYGIYFAIKYSLNLNIKDMYEKIKSDFDDDAIILLLSYIYDKKFNDSSILKNYINLAKKIKNDKDLDKFWIFIYEVLPESQLSENWKLIKQNGISFIKDGFS